MQFVLPGQIVSVQHSSVVSGPGTVMVDSKLYSTLAGYVCFSQDKQNPEQYQYSVIHKTSNIVLPERGQSVLCVVSRVSDSHVVVLVTHIEDNSLDVPFEAHLLYIFLIHF